MELPRVGGCLCGTVRYEVTEAPRLVYTCHCTDCQDLTSSAFSVAIAVAGFRLTGGEPRPLEAIADSGRTKIRWVCPQCGCWLFSTGKPGDGLIRVQAGTLDDTSWPRPTKHFWLRSKQPWIPYPKAIQRSIRNRLRSAALTSDRLRPFSALLTRSGGGLPKGLLNRARPIFREFGLPTRASIHQVWSNIVTQLIFNIRIFEATACTISVDLWCSCWPFFSSCALSHGSAGRGEIANGQS
jgi:hypothetical protein